jgi:hypothetical protein
LTQLILEVESETGTLTIHRALKTLILSRTWSMTSPWHKGGSEIAENVTSGDLGTYNTRRNFFLRRLFRCLRNIQDKIPIREAKLANYY